MVNLSKEMVSVSPAKDVRVEAHFDERENPTQIFVGEEASQSSVSIALNEKNIKVEWPSGAIGTNPILSPGWYKVRKGNSGYELIRR